MWSRFVMSQVKHNSYFLCGMALGLWVSLAVIPLDEEAGCAGLAPGPEAGAADEFEPAREQRPLGPAGQAAGRSVQRPRYYSTELGMRGSLLSGILSSEDALKTQVAALNQTMARLQPALKFFITASAMSAVPGLANVVGFTDTREMLKPFHALKYLADNYLEEYDFFFLATDGAYVNTRRLTELVSRLSVSQDIYMGSVAEDDSHYCSLDSGIILSNSVLRAVHGELDWCVRNSYSPRHHENLGRCVLHAAHLACHTHHQGESYLSVRLAGAGQAGGALRPELADAVSVLPAPPPLLRALHAYVARVQLERGRARERQARAQLWAVAARRPRGARAPSWPQGLRIDPGLERDKPDSRFEHLRWSLFNASHAFMPDEHRAVEPLSPPHSRATQLVVESALAWARRRWPWARGAALLEGASQWDPPEALRYRLLVALTKPDGDQVLRQLEAVRALGAARLVPERYVTESARLHLVLPVLLAAPGAPAAAAAFLQRQRQPLPNTFLHVVAFPEAAGEDSAELAALRADVAALGAGAALSVAAPGEAGAGGEELAQLAAPALRALRPRPPPDALLLFVPPDLEYNQDFLNRVRMSCIRGASWAAPLPFRRHAAKRARSPAGRFDAGAADVLAVYLEDAEAALAAWRGQGPAVLARALAGAAGLRGVRAPEPAAVLAPRAAPCPAPAAPAAPACRPALALDRLALGRRNALAQLLLEAEHGAL